MVYFLFTLVSTIILLILSFNSCIKDNKCRCKLTFFNTDKIQKNLNKDK